MADYLQQPEEMRQKTVKEFNVDDQPREKAERHGCRVLSTSELWAIILRTGTPGNPITSLCRNLMEDNDRRIKQLERRSRKELLKIKGIGMTKAIQIEAVLELIRRYNLEGESEKPVVRDSSDIARYMRNIITEKNYEEVWALYLNQRNQILAQKRISSGAATASIFDLKKILKHALLEEAQSVVLVHNHPSGNLRPSIQDDKITKECKAGCTTISLRMLDHVIVTDASHYSYNDNGRL